MKKTIAYTFIALTTLFAGSSIACKNEVPSHDPECHALLEQFGDVEIFGGFAFDLGCIFDHMTIDGKKYTYAGEQRYWLKSSYIRMIPRCL